MLIAAFFDETLTDAQLDTDLDRMMSFRLAAHGEIGTNDKEMHAEIVSVASPRGAFDQRFVSRFGDARQLQLTNGEDSQYRVWIEIHWAKVLSRACTAPVSVRQSSQGYATRGSRASSSRARRPSGAEEQR